MSLRRDRTLGAVGESGLGTTVLSRTMMGLIGDGFKTHVGGAVRFHRVDITADLLLAGLDCVGHRHHGRGEGRRHRISLTAVATERLSVPDRCPRITGRYAEEEPVLGAVDDGHHVACHYQLIEPSPSIQAETLVSVRAEGP